MTEAELLFTQILDCQRHSLYLNKEALLDRVQLDRISSALKRRAGGEPIQHILGNEEFMGLEFKVSGDVLIPRPETEILVEAVLKNLNPSRILDVGTGSGCIAVSLAKFIPGTQVDALDISHEALEVAKENAETHKVKINFIQSDLFGSCSLWPASYDLIVSNPPYVASGDIEGLQAEVRHEPRLALDGGRDGLDFYRRIIPGSLRYLKDGGYLVLEIGFDQKDRIMEIFQPLRDFKIQEVVKDYNNIDRVIVAKKA